MPQIGKMRFGSCAGEVACPPSCVEGFNLAGPDCTNPIKAGGSESMYSLEGGRGTPPPLRKRP